MPKPYQEDWFQMAPGVKRRILSTGEKLMVIHVHFEPGGVVALHSHHNEQISYVVKGKITFKMNDQEETLTEGESLLVPGGVQHMATAVEETLVAESFSPPRADFLEQLKRG